MVNIDELLMLTIGIGVLSFILANRDLLKQIPHYKLLFYSYLILVFGWILTVLEGFTSHTLPNLMEHFSYTLSTLLLFSWIIKISNKRVKKL